VKAALIGDVHANLPALEAVLEHARAQGAGPVWNVGDFVGYGAFPEQVVQRLRCVGAVSVIGNYDLKVLKVPHRPAKWSRSKRPEKWLAFKWAYENLSADSRNYLACVPLQVRLQVEGRRILLTHGSPDSESEHVDPDTPIERLEELAQVAEADIVVCGHSHRPFRRRAGGVLFVNTGSVGRPDDGDPRACYATMDLTAQDVCVCHHRVAYDVERAVAAIRDAGLPEAFARMILTGVSLDAVDPPVG